jgi:hypothetical protein
MNAMDSVLALISLRRRCVAPQADGLAPYRWDLSTYLRLRLGRGIEDFSVYKAGYQVPQRQKYGNLNLTLIKSFSCRIEFQ